MIDAFSSISFEFYPVHSLVLNQICDYLRMEGPLKEWLVLAMAAFIISVFLACLFLRQ